MKKLTKSLEKKLMKLSELCMSLELSYVLAVQISGEDKDYFISTSATDSERKTMNVAIEHAVQAQQNPKTTLHN